MAVTNLSLIEKDDLIKKMPRDALKEELRNPSGNFPLFLVASRLKEVEEMERDMMARQAAQQSASEPDTVAARLAQMQQAPMSSVGATPSPQPQPNPQGLMAQQVEGPQKPLPTVYREEGGFGLGALGGLAMPETYKALSDTFGRGMKYLGLAPYLASKLYGDRGEDEAPEAVMNPQEVAQPVAQPQQQTINAPVMVSEGGAMPTVYARSGLSGKYPGDQPAISAEILAAAVRQRQAKGEPRLYNQARKAGFERAGRKGAAPASQIPGILGLASALAKSQERAYGGMETLPPYQVESSTLPQGAKGFTSPARHLASSLPSEDSGLDYVSKLLQTMGGSSDDKPTVFAQDGFPGTQVDPRTGRTVIVDDTAQSAVIDYLNYPGPMPGPNEFFYRGNQIVPGRDFVESQMKRASGIQAAAGGMDVDPMSQMDLEGNPVVPTTTTIEEYKAAQAQKRAEEEAARVAAMQQRNRVRGRFALQAAGNPAAAVSQASASPPTAVGSSVKVDDTQMGQRVAGVGAPSAEAARPAPGSGTPAVAGRPVVTPPAASVTNTPPAPGGAVVTPPAAAGGPAASAQSMLGKLMERVEKAPKIPEVPSLSSTVKELEGLVPDLSPQRKQIISDYENQLKTIEAREAVPQSTLDMRKRMQDRLDALENSPIPFMTAAAAVIKGNQPILVAMTNAMIGYTAGDEKVKNQGMKIMSDIVDIDANVATMKAKQAELEMTARNALIGARKADIDGQDKRARELLAIATSNQNAARTAAQETAKLESSALNRIATLAASTFKTQVEMERFDTLKKAFMDQGLNEAQAMARAYSAMSPKSPSYTYENMMRDVLKDVDDWRTSGKTGEKNLRNAINAYNKKFPDKQVSPTQPEDWQIRMVIEAMPDQLPSDPRTANEIRKRYGGAANKAVPFSSLSTN